jgi:glycosyltransferase involved in cell wall biosynthesis
MRINWFSNAPWSTTGYGNQTRTFTPRIQKLGHAMTITAFYGLEGAILHWNGIPVYPRGHHMYGQDVIVPHALNSGAQLVITLMDAWVIAAEAFNLVSPEIEPQDVPKWVPWFPVDHDPLPQAVRDKVKLAYERIVYSKFGERMVQNSGLSCYYVPHGVDTKIYKPENKAHAREKARLPKDAYLVGMVAANKGSPSRKAFFQNIAGFKMLKDKHADAVLYLHTLKGEPALPETVNIPEYCRHLGLEVGKDVLFVDSYPYMFGIGDEYMAALYNSFDVTLSVTMGEGFGIPILESQACGTPVITGDWTSMSELTFGGLMVDKTEAEEFFTPLGANQYLPHAKAIGARLIQMYEAAPANCNDEARLGALNYDADLVTETYWKPCLQQISASLGQPKLAKVTKVQAPRVKR